jgi:hypothetical protein
MELSQGMSDTVAFEELSISLDTHKEGRRYDAF